MASKITDSDDNEVSEPQEPIPPSKPSQRSVTQHRRGDLSEPQESLPPLKPGQKEVTQRQKRYRPQSRSTRSASQRQGALCPQSTVDSHQVKSHTTAATVTESDAIPSVSSSSSEKLSKSLPVITPAISRGDSHSGKATGSWKGSRSIQRRHNRSGTASDKKPSSQSLVTVSDHVLGSAETESAPTIHKLSVGVAGMAHQSQPEAKPLPSHCHPQTSTESDIKPYLIPESVQAAEFQTDVIHHSSPKMLKSPELTSKPASKRNKSRFKSSRAKPRSTNGPSGPKDHVHGENSKSRHPQHVPQKSWKRRFSCKPALLTLKDTSEFDKGKCVKKHNGIGTNVLVTFSPLLFEEISKENWDVYFGEVLSVIRSVCYFHPQEKPELNMILEFESNASAEDAISKLKNVFLFGFHKMSFSLQKVLTLNPKAREVEPTIDCASFREELEEKRLASIEDHERETSSLKARNAKIIQKMPLDQEEIDKHRAEKELNKQKIVEIDSRQTEFLFQLSKIEAHLVQLEGSSLLSSIATSETVESLHARFLRECKRYERGLPIYAHRKRILREIEARQVCVIVADTGSGKSTQIVQYLYEAGYTSNGLIVCTQPRKLAAISLAEHVSKEVGEPVGKTYGYLATKSRRSKTTKVLFMTDHSLLNECIADPNLSQYACVVIDEAHERSIHTDILIAFVKRCLPNRPDLKVVITSATINPKLFSDYFGGFYESLVVDVPGRTYPVQVMWGEAGIAPVTERDYVAEAVDKAYSIHVNKQGKPGDILIFLTCPAEIERACKLLSQTLKSDAVVLPLHGKLQPEEQRKVFASTGMKRKVVISTNVAETSVTIPGIVYVIDSGLSKELCYDPEKNMNSLEIRPISKSSANQRKGRAGRTCPGECHRLYTEKSDYDRMGENSVPEIMRITLAFAVIKLFEFGIEDIHTFEFVESPKRKALDDAVKNLKFLGAIERGRLTALGRQMALLPLDPNLSKVLLDAIDCNVVIEAAIAISISTLAGRVFFRPEAPESREESERIKLPFCQQSGDQMTNLHTYFEWSHQKQNRSQNMWCIDNYVNAKSMRMVREIVQEILHILSTKCHFRIPPVDSITSLRKADEMLPRLYFFAFLKNVCIHLGHSRVGYWCESLPDEQLIIHPGSSLCSLASIPQCVVFERTHRTTQHFLLQVLPVREEWIQEAVSSGALPCHPAESPAFKHLRVSSSELLTFTHLGPLLSAKLRQEFPHDRTRIVQDFCWFKIPPVFEHSKDEGTLKVFAQECYHEEIHATITEFIEAVRSELWVETFKCSLSKRSDDVKMVIGRGGCIQHILMPGDFQKVVVRGLDELEIAYAKEILESIGECSFKVVESYRETQLIVSFKDSTHAAKALKPGFMSDFIPKATVQPHLEKHDNDFCLKVSWVRRYRKDYAWVNFPENISLEINAKLTSWRDSSGLNFTVSASTNAIKVNGVCKGTTEEQIKARLSTYMGFNKEELEFNDKDMDVHFFYSDPFTETDQSFLSKKEHLHRFLAKLAPEDSYYVHFNCPQPKNIQYKAFVYFRDSLTCWKACQQYSIRKGLPQQPSVSRRYESESDDSEEDDINLLDETKENGDLGACFSAADDHEVFYVSDSTDSYEEEDEWSESSEDSSSDVGYYFSDRKYKVELSLSSSTRCSRQVYSVIKPSVARIIRRHSSKAAEISEKVDKWGNKFVNISSNDLDAFEKAKKVVAKIVDPHVIFFEKKKHQYVSTLHFQKSMRDIQAKTSTYIQINSSTLTTSTISIYGAENNRKKAKERVEAHLQEVLCEGINCFEVHLKRERPGLMKHLVERYGTDVSGIIETVPGIAATKLTPHDQVLTLFATEAGYRLFLLSLEEYRPAGFVTQQAETPSVMRSSNQCCVCLESHDTKQANTFFYRLEFCGHVYCKECIELQLHPSSITFPVTCAAEGCETELVWRDFDNLFKHKVKKLCDITTPSLKSYVAGNSDKVHNCTTPDCKAVYLISEEGRCFSCKSCGADICTRCHSAWHPGFDTCLAYKNRDNVNLSQWIKDDPKMRKNCPKCSVPIEKLAGCEHMACTQCKSHICWLCLKFFSSSDACYDHLSARHGGCFQH